MNYEKKIVFSDSKGILAADTVNDKIENILLMESSNYLSENLFPHHDSASLVNVHLVTREIPIDMVNQEVKSESNTIYPSPSHEVNHKVFQVLQIKRSELYFCQWRYI